MNESMNQSIKMTKQRQMKRKWKGKNEIKKGAVSVKVKAQNRFLVCRRKVWMILPELIGEV